MLCAGSPGDEGRSDDLVTVRIRLQWTFRAKSLVTHRNRVARGELLGPAIFTSGPFISSSTGSSPTLEQVESAVVAQKKAGYDLIKIHGDFSREAYHKLFEVARREGMRVIGHLPRNLGIEAAFEEKQDAIALVLRRGTAKDARRNGSFECESTELIIV